MKRLHSITGLALAALLTLGSAAVQAATTSTEKNAAAAKDGFRVHNLFQSNMVVQRAKPISVWGWSTPGDKVSVAFAGNSADAVAGKDGKWKATLPGMEANSTPSEMTIKSKEGSITLKNILVGDVWVLGGQSNMAWSIGGTQDGNIEVASANFSEIRFIGIPKIFGPELKENFPRAEEFSKISGKDTKDGDWQVCSPETIGSLSAIGYIMTRRIHMATQIPIGVINTSRGGTLVEAWTPEARLRKMDAPRAKEVVARYDEKVAAWSAEEDLAKQVRKHESRVASMKKEGKKIPANMKPPTKPGKGPMYSHNRPGNCYSSVIAPIAGFAVKGAIFHQGYNNCFQGVWGSEMYRVVFPEMIHGWREAFNDESLPFGILSQCVAGKTQSPDDFLPRMTDIGARVREAQYQTFLELYDAGDTNIGFMSTYDLRHVSYHPRIKVAAGERAAAWALASQYGMEDKMKWLPPRLKEMKAVEGTLHLVYDQRVESMGGGVRPMEGFAIAGEDGKFHLAKVSPLRTGGTSRKPQYDYTTLVLSSPMIEKPVHYRYGWARNPMGNVRMYYRFGNVVMLPTQRSDTWTNGDLLKALTGIDAETPLKLERGDSNKLRGALAKEDQRRKIAEAKAVLEEAAAAEAAAAAKAK